MKHVLEHRVDYRPVADLLPSPRNSRTHSARQIAQIVASIREFGFTNPILIDENRVIIAGHGRLEAARKAGLSKVPVISLEHLGDAQKRALALADNKIALNAGWDDEMLRLELTELSAIALDFDIELTGFDMPEIDLLLTSDEKSDPADEPVEVEENEIVSREGDVWILGQHRLLCGNALEQASYDALLGDEIAQMAITDPPYNVAVTGHVSGTGKHREFKMASGEMTEAEFRNFLKTALMCVSASLQNGAVVDVFMDWRHLADLFKAADAVFGAPLNLCVWNKTNAGMGSLYRSKHELVAVFKKGTAPHINNIELGKHGRYRTNVWDYAGANTFRRGRDQDLDDHPTIKPTAMIADAMLDCSTRGGVILDPFAGSGTVILAAHRTGRLARAIELDPRYVDVAIKRWRRFAKGSAVLEETGESFEEIAARRNAEGPSTASPSVRRRNKGGQR